MAANRIKGITIEIGGDTTKLQKALQSVDKNLKDTQTSLKDVNKLLKLDPTNTDLLKQKQDLLKTSIQETEERLKTLREAYKQLDGNASEETKKQQEALKREIIDTEQNLKSLKEQYRDFGSVAKQQLETVGESIKNVGGKLTDAGKDLSVKLTAPIVALGTAGVSYNAKMEQYATMFTTLTGSAEEADRVISQLQQDAQRSPFDTDSLIKANQYLISAGVSADDARKTIQDLGNAVAATGGGSDELNRMAANLQQIKNVGKASAQDIKQFANAGINIYGLLADSMGKTVEQVKDMDVSYEVLAEALSKASEEGGKYYGAMEAQSQTLSGSISSLKDNIQQLLGQITSAAMPVIKKVLARIKDVVQWFSNLDDSQKETILKIAAIVAAIGPALTILGTVISTLGTLVSAIGMLFTPMGTVITIMGLVVAAGVALYKNWDTIKEKATILWKNVVSAFESLKQGAIEKFESLKKSVSEAVEKIKSNLVQKFGEIKDQVVQKIINLKDSVANIFTNMISSAWNWGKDLVKNMIGGVESKMSDFSSTIKRVASRAESMLGFSEPEEGPLSDFHTWMPDFMQGLADDINRSSYLVEDAITNVAGMMRAGTTSVNYGGVVVNMNVPQGTNGYQLVDEIESALAQRTVRRKAVFA